MAHTLFLTRGHWDSVQPFIDELRNQYLNYKMYNPETKKMEDKVIKMRVCPIQLWDISYPLDQRDAIHTTVFGGSDGKPFRKRESKFVYAMRKILGLEKMPKYKNDQWLRMSFPRDTDIIAIGVKDDYWIEPDGRHVSTKEKSEFAQEGI